MDLREEITALLQRVRAGDADAEGELFTHAYSELRERAARMLAGQRRITLETGALVNEACLKLIGRPLECNDREHFFAVASRAMRSVLVDYVRSRGRVKRGGGRRQIPFDDVVIAYEERSRGLLELDEALVLLAAEDERSARVVEMRFFGGMTLAEIGVALGVGLRTVERDWGFARAWLHRRLS